MKNIAVTTVAAILTISGMYLWLITTYISGWSHMHMGEQLFMASPAGLLWLCVVGIVKEL